MAITITADLVTAVVEKRGMCKHTQTKKHAIIELHARAVAPHDPHTPPLPKTALTSPPLHLKRLHFKKMAITITADLRAAEVGKGGISEHAHINKQEIVELHARAVALHNPHTLPFRKPP
jgi:hypothetical protein